MTMVTFAFGLFTLIIFAFLSYYTSIVLKQFHSNTELAATNLVLKDDVPEAFRILSISGAIFSTLAFIGFGSLLTTGIDFGFLLEVGGTFMILGFTLFMRKIAHAVRTDHREQE